MSRQQHHIKILPEYYRAIERGEKTFEVRKDDRNYQVYDFLYLEEWCGGEYTGRYIGADITYILRDPQYCKEGYVVMSIRVRSVNN